MFRIISLAVFLLIFWLALSGHYTAFLIGVGLGVVGLCVLMAQRMRVLDEESQPLHVFAQVPMYWGWLFVEIAKSAWAVTRVIWNPRLPISPTMTRVKAMQRTPAGMATFANSITLTPGTITTAVKDDVFTVHALVRESADDVEGGDMNRRVCKFEGVA